jgi:hypothetical protein
MEAVAEASKPIPQAGAEVGVLVGVAVGVRVGVLVGVAVFAPHSSVKQDPVQ